MDITLLAIESGTATIVISNYNAKIMDTLQLGLINVGTVSYWGFVFNINVSTFKQQLMYIDIVKLLKYNWKDIVKLLKYNWKKKNISYTNYALIYSGSRCGSVSFIIYV